MPVFIDKHDIMLHLHRHESYDNLIFDIMISSGKKQKKRQTIIKGIQLEPAIAKENRVKGECKT